MNDCKRQYGIRDCQNVHRGKGKFRGADIVAYCTSIGRSSAIATINKLTEEGLIIREGSEKSTFYVRADSK